MATLSPVLALHVHKLCTGREEQGRICTLLHTMSQMEYQGSLYLIDHVFFQAGKLMRLYIEGKYITWMEFPQAQTVMETGHNDQWLKESQILWTFLLTQMLTNSMV